MNTSAGTSSLRLASWLARQLPAATVIQADAGQDLKARLIAASSIRRIASSASASRPWVISHRGLSGRLRRTIRITKASAGPARKATRQRACCSPSWRW